MPPYTAFACMCVHLYNYYQYHIIMYKVLYALVNLQLLGMIAPLEFLFGGIHGYIVSCIESSSFQGGEEVEHNA